MSDIFSSMFWTPLDLKTTNTNSTYQGNQHVQDTEHLLPNCYTFVLDKHTSPHFLACAIPWYMQTASCELWELHKRGSMTMKVFLERAQTTKISMHAYVKMHILNSSISSSIFVSIPLIHFTFTQIGFSAYNFSLC